MNYSQTIESLSDDLAKLVEPMGWVLLPGSMGIERYVSAQATMVDEPERLRAHLLEFRSILGGALRRQPAFAVARTSTVSKWCQGFVRGWLMHQVMGQNLDFDAFTWPSEKMLPFGPCGVIVEDILKGKEDREHFNNYVKAVRLSTLYDSLSEQIKNIDILYTQSTIQERADFNVYVNQEPVKDEIQSVRSIPFLTNEIRQPLYNAIAPFVDNSDHEALKALILNGEALVTPLNHHCQQNSLGYLFRQLHESGHMTGTQIGISEWICNNFRGTTINTIYDSVRGKTQPHKQRRIEIKL